MKEAEAAAAEPPKSGGKGKESLSNADLARLIVVKPVSSRFAVVACSTLFAGCASYACVCWTERPCGSAQRWSWGCSRRLWLQHARSAAVCQPT